MDVPRLSHGGLSSSANREQCEFEMADAELAGDVQRWIRASRIARFKWWYPPPVELGVSPGFYAKLSEQSERQNGELGQDVAAHLGTLRVCGVPIMPRADPVAA